jgi:hypothetical protein
VTADEDRVWESPTQLDDLLGYAEEPERVERRRGSGWKTVLTLVVLVLASFVVYRILQSASVGTPYVLILAVMLALVALRRVLTGIKAPALPVTLNRPPPRRRPETIPGDGIRAVVRSWDNRLDYAHDDQRQLARMIRPAITDIVDERLRLRHGVHRDTDPDRAQEIMGPRLWKFVTGPVPRRMSPQDVATLVAQMEAL